jgi:hypothetical protein
MKFLNWRRGIKSPLNPPKGDFDCVLLPGVIFGVCMLVKLLNKLNLLNLLNNLSENATSLAGDIAEKRVYLALSSLSSISSFI